MVLNAGEKRVVERGGVAVDSFNAEPACESQSEEIPQGPTSVDAGEASSGEVRCALYEGKERHGAYSKNVFGDMQSGRWKRGSQGRGTFAELRESIGADLG